MIHTMSETQKQRAEIQIEPVRREELQELAELAARSFRDAFGYAMDEDDLRQTLKEGRSVEYFEKTFDSSTILVAKQDNKIVGYAQFGTVKIPDIDKSGDDRELGRLYIDTAMQGQGIGRQLMDAALSDSSMLAAPNIYLQVWEKNAKAIPLYTSYGFETVGVTNFELAGKPAQDLVMVRHQQVTAPPR
jgi:ribosomal protein S18 acetylase RimI-like enzyme